MSDLDLDALEAVARAASPEPWRLIGGGEYVEGVGVPVSYGEGVRERDDDCLVAFDPPTVLALIARVKEAEQERDKHLAARLASVDLRAIISDINTLLDTPSDERGITWWEWIEGGLGGTLHDDLRAVLSRYKPSRENGSER